MSSESGWRHRQAAPEHGRALGAVGCMLTGSSLHPPVSEDARVQPAPPIRCKDTSRQLLACTHCPSPGHRPGRLCPRAQPRPSASASKVQETEDRRTESPQGTFPTARLMVPHHAEELHFQCPGGLSGLGHAPCFCLLTASSWIGRLPAPCSRAKTLRSAYLPERPGSRGGSREHLRTGPATLGSCGQPGTPPRGAPTSPS